MSSLIDLEHVQPDHVFDGGDLDCGSGLVLLIRENMQRVPKGGILEMRSREPTVADDLPPWCRMSGHTYLGALVEPGYVRYFIQSGSSPSESAQALESDKQQAQTYEWRLRTRVTGHQKSTVYCRNFSFDVGQLASFEEKDLYPSAVEYVLGALSASLATGLATEAVRDGLEIDDIEISTRGQIENVLAMLGMDPGEAAFSTIEVKVFVSTLEDEARVQAAWDRVVQRSPLVGTLRRGVPIALKLSIV